MLLRDVVQAGAVAEQAREDAEVDLVDQAAIERDSGMPFEGEKISTFLPFVASRPIRTAAATSQSRRSVEARRISSVIRR
jgi:hypothetical protein